MPAKLDAWFSEIDSVRVHDSRDPAAPYEREWSGLAARLLFACDTASTVAGLARRPELPYSADEIEATLNQLVRERLVLEDERHYLSLPVFRARPPAEDQRLANAYITAKASAADALLGVV